MKTLAQKKYAVTTFSLVLRQVMNTLEDGKERSKTECVELLQKALHSHLPLTNKPVK